MLKVSLQFLPICSIYFMLWGLLPHVCSCSNTSAIPMEHKIVHGYRCSIRDHPYMISIQYTSNFQHRCGGTIISELWILTAGHCCLDNYKLGIFSAVAGVSVITGRYVQKHLIARNYKYSDKRYRDIGLMELGYPITETDSVRYVQLNTGVPIENICHEGTVVGWGIQYSKNIDGRPLSTPIPPHDPHLQCVSLPIIDKAECETKFGFVIPPTLICAYANYKGACQKDSGGPLMCNGIQYGIVSFGAGCGHGDSPDAFTRVALFDHFIRSVTLKNTELPHLCKRANYLIIIQYLLFVLYCK